VIALIYLFDIVIKVVLFVCVLGMLKKIPKSRTRGTLVSSFKLIILVEIAAVGLSYYVWRKMCRQQGLLKSVELVFCSVLFAHC